LQPVKKLTEKK
uniref:Tetratricopeptide repeat, ankyrin repeat and coiled-coil containing 2 n=2 Tax=Hystricomorpha TaxID=33550 RepID=A0A286XLH4_CAVPO